jgi:hypothetical protein
MDNTSQTKQEQWKALDSSSLEAEVRNDASARQYH